MVTIEIGKNEAEQRLDRFLRKYLGDAPLSLIYRIIRKDCKVNGRRAREHTVLQAGDQVTLYLADETVAQFRQARPVGGGRREFAIAYEDDDVLIAEKPAGLLTHGDQREKKHHLTNQVVAYLIGTGAYVPQQEKTFAPAPVNRLDRNTSGLVLFGKNNPTLQQLNRLMRERTQIRKFYLTVTAGLWTEARHLTGSLTRDTAANRVTVQDAGAGRSIETLARPLAWGDGCTLAEVELLTGRTHQIRAHLAAAGHPIIGDGKYGDPDVNRRMLARFGLRYQLLHAYKLSFADSTEVPAGLRGRTVTAQTPELLTRIEQTIFAQNDRQEGGTE